MVEIDCYRPVLGQYQVFRSVAGGSLVGLLVDRYVLLGTGGIIRNLGPWYLLLIYVHMDVLSIVHDSKSPPRWILLGAIYWFTGTWIKNFHLVRSILQVTIWLPTKFG